MPKLPKVSYYVEFLSRTQVITILNMNLDIKHHMLNAVPMHSARTQVEVLMTSVKAVMER